MIKIENLCTGYGKDLVLKEVSLEIPKGTSCAIIGHSGCGKTTLLYSIAGLIAIHSGNITIQDEPLETAINKMSLILQNLGLFPWKTVEGNILMGLKKSSLTKKEKSELVNNILHELDIQDISHKYINQLSGGQKQRVAIARTLVNNPDVFLFDEATSALDAMTKERIQELLLSIHEKRKNTIVFVTHSIEEAVFLGNQIVVMDKGQIKGIIHNEHFGDSQIRKREEYFHICNKVRGYLYE